MKTVFKTIRPVNIVFQMHRWRKYCGRFTDIVALKTNDSYFLFFVKAGEEKGAVGEAHGKFSESRLFNLMETPFLM